MNPDIGVQYGYDLLKVQEKYMYITEGISIFDKNINRLKKEYKPKLKFKQLNTYKTFEEAKDVI